jgi:PKHD-type hydroxylase
MVTILKGLLTQDDLRRAHLWLAKADWEDGRRSAGDQARSAKHNLQMPYDHPSAAPLRELVIAGLDQSTEFFSTALPKRIMTPAFNRYDPEHPQYDWHVDNCIRIRKEDGIKVRTDLSCTVFLNGPHEYEGGSLLFENGDLQTAIKLNAGDAVVYPSGLLHKVAPVSKGQRLACFFWIESMVRGQEQRQMLVQLDQSLTQLRNEQGESEASRRLMGVYHQMLRLWAEP